MFILNGFILMFYELSFVPNMEGETTSVDLLKTALIECRGLLLSNHVSYSVCPGFEYRAGEQLS
jgi:hypothetical protein